MVASFTILLTKKSLIVDYKVIVHCKNESVYCTPFVPTRTQFLFLVCVLGQLVCSTHFHFYSVSIRD